MSCLPELFTSSKSQNLPQGTKIGGMFSINLRSAYFNTLRRSGESSDANANTKSLSFSLQTKRYSSFTNRPQSRRTSKSFYKKKADIEERGLEQNGHINDNLNSKITNQAEIESISSFNILKKNAYESLHLCKKTLEFTSSEVNTIKEQLAKFNQQIVTQLTKISQQFVQKCQNLTKQFRIQRRQMISQSKTINQQLSFLRQQLQTAKQINKQLHSRQVKIVNQFI